MITSFRCGLVVGKFSPLHRGHQLLIETALAQCEHVVIVCYSQPELGGCTAALREHWLKALYPHTTRIVATDAPDNSEPAETHRAFTADLLPRTVDAVFTSESYGSGFAEYLERRQRSPVTHVLVDIDRRVVPISGTAIRAAIHANREYLHPMVYASFVKRIAVLGGESSGKSTLAAALAEELSTCFVSEYGRERWEEVRGALMFEDLEHIAREQIRREELAVQRAHRYVFCDTSPLTTLFYSRDLFGRASSALEQLADREYAHTLLCAPDFAFVQDGTRRDSDFRDRQHRWYLEELARREIPYLLVQGDIRARVEQARKSI
jgi:NadR type nicotinamide-nucleotide adenylyltransferase